jgi:hypothetical protein
MEPSPINKSESPEFYLAHHAVFKESNTTIKLRVVFDGSAKSSSNYSLNDILMVGPVVQQKLYFIVLRYRSHLITVTADIAKMFRQVLVGPHDRSLQKILWRDAPHKEMKCYRLKNVTYGTAPAAFLSTRCLQQLAFENQEAYPRRSAVLASDFYVDHHLRGAKTVAETQEIQEQLTAILFSGGFPVHEWCLNSDEVLSNVPSQDTETSLPCQLSH